MASPGIPADLDLVVQLASASEYRDGDILFHLRRVSGYSAAIASALDIPAEQVELIRLGSPLHDVGKVCIPEGILYKPGKLTDAEFALTRRHTQVGYEILSSSPSPLFQVAADIAHSHHERWDGSGYPRSLRGDQIPIAGRILALADVFDALTTRRVYKPAMGVEQSLKIIEHESGKNFDPAVVEAFRAVLPQILEVKQAHATPFGV